MLKRTVSGITLTLLLIGMLTLAFNIELVEAEPTAIYVDDDNTAGPWDGTPDHPYQNITSGLEHAIAGDTIFVCNGTYTEYVVVDKALSLIGESNVATIIDANATISSAVQVLANNVNISGFTIQDVPKVSYYGFGILLHAVNICNIFDNRILNTPVAIFVRYSHNNTIKDNYVENDSVCGIGVLFSSHNNTISGNILTKHKDGGWEGAILLREYADNNIVSGNNITQAELCAIMIDGTRSVSS